MNEDPNITQYNALGVRADDLRFILLRYGKQLGSALAAVQQEAEAADKDHESLSKKMEKTGEYVWYDGGGVSRKDAPPRTEMALGEFARKRGFKVPHEVGGFMVKLQQPPLAEGATADSTAACKTASSAAPSKPSTNA